MTINEVTLALIQVLLMANGNFKEDWRLVGYRSTVEEM